MKTALVGRHAFGLLKRLLMVIIIATIVPVRGTCQSAKASDALDTSTMAKVAHFTPEQSDSLLVKIEHLHNVLNIITNASQYGFGTIAIERHLPEIQEYLLVINRTLSYEKNVLNIKDLEMFNDLLGKMQATLDLWRDLLLKNNRSLIKMNAEMTSFVQDSFTQKVSRDTTFAKLYSEELQTLVTKWNEAQPTTQQTLLQITALQAQVSNSYFKAVDLQNNVRNLILRSGVGTFSKEYDYLWLMRTNTATPSQVFERTKQSYLGQQKILMYFLKLNLASIIWLLGIGAIFFIWVLRNFRKLNSGKAIDIDTIDETFKIEYLKPIPILSTFVFILTLAPFFNDNPPAAYVEFTEFVLLIALTFVFRQKWPRPLFIHWLIMVTLFVLATVMNTVTVPGLTTRLSLLVLNIASLIFGVKFFTKDTKQLSLAILVKIVTVIYIIMNGFAILANVYGRYSLAKLLTSASIMSFAQLIGLTVFFHILMEAVFLQITSSRVAKGKPAAFKHGKVLQVFRRLFFALIILFWLFVFASNLSVYDNLSSIIGAVLNRTHKIGSTTFTYSNIVIFAVVIYVAGVLQQYIAYFFGEAKEDFENDLKKKGSKTVLFRLLIIVVGFLIAIIASGLPVDKVTVVLGALGVGIGLGLQQVVNNLVSGVIIIFEKPMQVGDYIEIGDKKGRVQDISIRSSRIVTADGAQVIVPNGDILSSHMVNWTQSDNNRRSEIVFTMDPSTEIDKAKEIITEVMKNDELVVQGRPVEILLDNVTEKTVKMSVRVWINNLYREREFKSDAISKIHDQFAENGIKIVS